MSCQITYSRQVLQRVSDRKKRKLAIDDPNKVLEHDFNSSIMPDSQLELVEDSESSLKGHRDLFGELIPNSSYVNNPKTNSNSNKKMSNSKRKKRPQEEFVISPIKITNKVFFPSPRIINIMKDAQTELYTLMGLNKSSSDVSIISNNSLNVSGIQSLLDSPNTTPNTRNESNTSMINNENNKDPSRILEGVVAFVDYKIDYDRSGTGIKQCLIKLGAKVEKTFNLKVTHVVFYGGYRKTYNTAIERNIPLVSARWVEKSKLANKMLDPVDYPPVDIENYKKIQHKEVDLSLPKHNTHKKFLRQSNIERDNVLKDKCHHLIQQIKNFTSEHIDENEENCDIVETPKKLNSIKEHDDPYKINDMISIISDQLCKYLNTSSPVPDEEIEELYLPMSIKVLKKMLTPKEMEKKTYIELDSDLVKIENRLNLNIKARQRLRKLLFPSDKELLDMSSTNDFPSPSPQKLRISAPAKLTSTKKHKMMLDKEILPHNKILNDKENTPQNKNNVLQWTIPSDLRPNKIKEINYQKQKIIQSQDTINSVLSRNSSIIFQTPKDSIISPIILQTIACTGMSKSEIEIIKLSIRDLGSFVFHAKVEPSTTFLVTKVKPNRTLNMVFAMAFGCYIISENWIHESYKIGRWLSYQKYLISNLSEPVKEFQTRRHTFGSLLTFHIFDNAGKIYISDTCDPSAKQLKQLVRACGGICTSIESLATVVVGYTQRMMNNVNEKWILDSISQGTLLDKCQYILTSNIYS